MRSVEDLENRTSYDTFGRVWTSTTPSAESRFAFTGRDFDPESDLYHYRARYYDPATGQFISADPIGFEAGDGNLYRYVGNGPNDRMDPTGLIVLTPEEAVRRREQEAEFHLQLQRFVKARRAQPAMYRELNWRDQIMAMFGASKLENRGLDDLPDVTPTEQEIRAFASWSKARGKVAAEAWAASIIPVNSIMVLPRSVAAAKSAQVMRSVGQIDTSADLLRAGQASRLARRFQPAFVITTLDDGVANASTIAASPSPSVTGTAGVVYLYPGWSDDLVATTTVSNSSRYTVGSGVGLLETQGPWWQQTTVAPGVVAWEATPGQVGRFSRLQTPWGRNVWQRPDIDWSLRRPDGLTNLRAARDGYTPLRRLGVEFEDVQLHHLNQDVHGGLVEVWASTHRQIGHNVPPPSWRVLDPDAAATFNRERFAYWRWRAQQIPGGE